MHANLVQNNGTDTKENAGQQQQTLLLIDRKVVLLGAIAE